MIKGSSNGPDQGLPKNIFMYWHDGFEDAPEVVHVCLRQAQKLNPGWTFHLLDRHSIKEYLPNNPVLPERWDSLDNAKKANLYRVWLLDQFGGLWIDATAFCMIPFDEWLPERMSTGLLFFRDPGPDRILSNWFIVSHPQNSIVKKFIESYVTYWNSHSFRVIGHPVHPVLKLVARVFGRSPALSRLWLTRPFTRWLRVSPYFAFHYIFHELLRNDSTARALWDEMPYISAKQSHMLLRHGLNSPISPEIEQELSSPATPIFKLTWKQIPDPIRPGTVWERLVELSNQPAGQSVSAR
jgi:hypothetical protein